MQGFFHHLKYHYYHHLNMAYYLTLDLTHNTILEMHLQLNKPFIY